MKRIIFSFFLISILIVFSSCSSSGGGSTPSNLPTCSDGALMSVLPVAIDDILNISPLGGVNPSGHAFPIDHIYIYIVKESAESEVPISTNVYMPGNAWITSMSSSEHLSADPPYTDYSLDFMICNKFTGQFGHIQTLTSEFLSLIGDFSDDDCREYSTGGDDYRMCSKDLEVYVEAGTLIGTTGGRAGQNALDFTAHDGRVTAITFANPDRWGANSDTGNDVFHVVCPIDYFTDSEKTMLDQKLMELRTATPVCGDFGQDVPNTAQGIWFVDGTTSTYPEDPNLALVHYNLNPSYQVISNGTSVPNLDSGIYMFEYLSSGNVNRDFEDITSNGEVYCYETESYTGDEYDFIIIIDMPTSTTLRIEKKDEDSCGAGPWSFTSNAKNFER